EQCVPRRGRGGKDGRPGARGDRQGDGPMRCLSSGPSKPPTAVALAPPRRSSSLQGGHAELPHMSFSDVAQRGTPRFAVPRTGRNSTSLLFLFVLRRLIWTAKMGE